MPRSNPRSLVVASPMVACLLLGLSACGDRPPVVRAAPLGPQHYVIGPEDKPSAGEFVRYAAPGPSGGGLDVAVTDYDAPAGGRPVRLIGVVHVADDFYYQNVQKDLDECSVVLYEAVKPAAMDFAAWIRNQGSTRDEMEGFQHAIAGWFGFRWQLEAIDYASPRFVHADMTLEEFRAAGGSELLPDLSLEDAEDRVVPTGVRNLMRQLRSFGDYAMAEDNPMRSLLRRELAKALGTQDLERALEMFPGLSDLILVRRNEVAFQKLEETLPEGTGMVGVFYGAAHMPGLERDLTSRLGYQRRDGHWLRAWALRAPLR